MRTSTPGLCGAVLALSVAALTPDVARSQLGGVSYPRAGVVCDTAGPVCYDGYGASIAFTEQYFGAAAANRLSQALQQSSSRDFRLSTGQACVVAPRTCFDDGWNQTQVAAALSRQLYGTAADGSNGNGNPPNANGSVSSAQSLCNLSQAGRNLFNGPCQLKQVSQDGQTNYRIQLQNGKTFVFKQVGGGYQIRDGFGGSWPVQFVRQGNSGVFSFADYRLQATQPNSSPTSRDAALGAAIGNLLNTLFRN